MTVLLASEKINQQQSCRLSAVKDGSVALERSSGTDELSFFDTLGLATLAAAAGYQRD